MRRFKDFSFNGEFRDYQQRVLDNADHYLEDGKINIVAAPGSGKTILGLELIRRLNEPALILSPTVIIRQQWGARFIEYFLDREPDKEAYVSYHLKSPACITSITYQTLHAAMERLKNKEEDEGEVSTDSDFEEFDLINEIHRHGIKTICLDEAHHLKSQWQKSLEKFIEVLKQEVKIISLTATPPYDSSDNDWKRYISMCGEIDEEIYVPELVKEHTLCPHQDYIFFNYPDKKELELVKEFRLRSANCVSSIIKNGLLDSLLESSQILVNYKEMTEVVLDNAEGFNALLCLAGYHGIDIPKKLIRLVCSNKKLPAFHLKYAEIAFRFVLEQPELFDYALVKELEYQLKQNRLIKRNQVCLQSDEEVNKVLVSSAGKLEGIRQITLSEYNQMRKKLRMVILTDYIRKELISVIGGDKSFGVIGTVPIFEAVRQSVGDRCDIGLLSGSLVIWPTKGIEKLRRIAASRNIIFTEKELKDTAYSEIIFKGSNREKVSLLTQAFEQGEVNILIGTSALLGEGWDSPCINSLIMASFVGSFVLSNQMRGRAIRTDKNNPDKTANIWHLVTVEPKLGFDDKIIKQLCSAAFYDNQILVSDDYETLKRRFECFFAPAYQSDIIENGIERIEIVKPPFDSEGIKSINDEMLQLAADRTAMSEHWGKCLKDKDMFYIFDFDRIPNRVLPTRFLFINLMNMGILLAFLTMCINMIISKMVVIGSLGIPQMLIAAGITLLIILGLIRVVMKILNFISPEKTVRTFCECILKTLMDMGEIHSPQPRLLVKAESQGIFIDCAIDNATVHEKNVFSNAVKELLTSINNPRYILTKTYSFIFWEKTDYSQSYACPSIIGVNKESAEILAGYLKKAGGFYQPCFTRNEKGKKLLTKCRRKSYINRNEIYIERKQRVGTL